MKLARLAIALSLATTALPAIASPDARSLGMGGTGVATAHGAAAAFHNPALLARHGKERFSLILPALQAGLTDADDTLTDFQDIQDGSMQATTDAFNAFQASTTVANGQALGAAVNRLDTDLASIDKGTFDARLGVMPLSFAVLRDTTSFALSTNASVRLEGMFNYNDQGLLSGYSSLLTDGAITNTEANDPANGPYFDATCVASQNTAITPAYEPCLLLPEDTLQSAVGVVGLATAEVGFSFARTVTIGGQDLQVGVTPKFQQVRTYYYLSVANSHVSGSELSDYEKSYTTGNLDIGLAKTFAGTPWSVGLAVTNLIPQEFETVVSPMSGSSFTLEMAPKVTVGGEGHWKRATLTADLDLTKTESLTRIGNDEQFLSVGGEFGWRALNLRAGYRHNLANSEYKGGLTAGLGLGPVSVSGLYADNAASVVVQFSTPY